uniref:Uncharacterized protein n=1 Tax=Molossus molossus TaxID=27622 RepID=A0A7J8F972_MOLMO|nr:hypothetical protein HJG59_008585 [Molossus molossus]
MRIWKVFSPASLPKPPGQPSLHSFHPQLSFQLLKRSGRERGREAAQRPLLPALFVGEGVAESGSPSPDPYLEMYIPLGPWKIASYTHHSLSVSLYKYPLSPDHTCPHRPCFTLFVTYKSSLSHSFRISHT